MHLAIVGDQEASYNSFTGRMFSQHLELPQTTQAALSCFAAMYTRVVLRMIVHTDNLRVARAAKPQFEKLLPRGRISDMAEPTNRPPELL